MRKRCGNTYRITHSGLAILMFVFSLAMADAAKAANEAAQTAVEGLSGEVETAKVAANLLSVQWQNDTGSMIEQFLYEQQTYEKDLIKTYDGSLSQCTKIVKVRNVGARSPGRGGTFNKGNEQKNTHASE